MNSWPNITQAIASVAYVIVTLIGFLLIRRQIKQVDFSTRRDAYGELYTQQHSITRFFLDRPALRSFFYDNEPITDAHIEYKNVMVVAEMMADFLEHIYVQLPSLPPDIQIGWQSYLRYIYDHSPAVRTHFKEKGVWYSHGLVQLLRSEAPSSSSRDKTRTIIRSIHLLFALPIFGYIYGPPSETLPYLPYFRFIYLPAVVLSGLWMWKGHVFRRLISK